MADAQELANRIGAAQRATEAAIAAGDLATAGSKAAEQHQNLTDAFAYVRDVLGLDLDWNQAAGNPVGGAKGAHTSGGGSKDSPPSSNNAEV